MPAITPLFRSVLLAVTLTASGWACAQPFGYSINSRGDFEDSSRVFALWRIDLATGEESYIGWTGQGDFIDIEGLAFNAEGKLFGVDDSTHTLVRIGTESGNAAPVGGSVSNLGIPLGQSMDFGLTFTCNGQMLVSSAGNNEIYLGDPESGRLERIGDTGVPIVDLATIDDVVYGIGKGTNSAGQPVAPNLYRIDAEAPTVELIGALGEQASAYNQAGLAADGDGNLWAITDRNRVGDGGTAEPSEILRIDPATGRAEKVAETIVGIESLAIAPPSSCDGGNRGDPPPGPDDSSPIPTLSDGARGLLILLLLALAASRLRPLQS